MDDGEATRGVEDDHDGVVAVVLGARDGVVEVLLGDRVDVVVECRRKHAWPRLLPVAVTRLGDRDCRNREGSHAEREQQSPKWATVHAVRIASTEGSAACARTVCEQLCPQMRRLLVLFLMLTAGAVLPATSVAGVASVATVDLIASPRPVAELASGRAPLHPRRPALARHRQGRVPDALARGPLDVVAACCAGGRRRSRSGLSRESSDADGTSGAHGG